MSTVEYTSRFRQQLVLALSCTWAPGMVSAHASEQGFVLLLPTDIYMIAGTTCVAATVVLLAILPETVLAALFRPRSLIRWPRLKNLTVLTSGLSFLFLAALVWAGLNGSRDPFENPLPLTIWTVWWIALVTVQGLFGDIWRWVNPWTGPVWVVRRTLVSRPLLHLPPRLGYGGAILTYLGFVAVLLADPAPSDPARLAGYVAGYWAFTCVAMIVFGQRWVLRGEGFTMLMRNYATLALFGRVRRRLRVGLFGWQALRRRPPRFGAAVFMLLMLGSGSFDGLNETFWWLDLLGLNPLEFPGRSAVIGPNVIGLIVANAALIAAYGLAIWLGLRLIASGVPTGQAFCLFAPSILPIALGYHIAHYFSSFLVESQYVLAVINDPLDRGADLLGLGRFYVTTGFFNTHDSARTIWLTQAGAVVLGHILAILMAHAIAVRQFGSNRRAAASQAPLAVFMVLYTFFGLWLLASPRGV